MTADRTIDAGRHDPAAARRVGDFLFDALPGWLELAQDDSGAVAERLEAPGKPLASPERTTLTQARLVFTFAHLHLATGSPWMREAAIAIHRYLDTALRDEDGGYRVAALASGAPSAAPEHALRRTYDQSFALLALVTLRRAAPEAVPEGRVEACWNFISTRLTDPATGALWEDDAMAARGPWPGELRAQNPHMHMIEALLQAHEMTGEAVWRDRAAGLVEVGLRHFLDPDTGAIREFTGHDLAPFDTADGWRREPGHQYEWAWLLRRFAAMGGDPAVTETAARMQRFVEAHGLRRDGPLAGAPFDAVSADGAVTEPEHLLWPLTEAGKLYADLHAETGDREYAARALALLELIFARYVADGSDPFWVNRLDRQGRVLWPEALSRLLYHLALFLTEGGRAGLWSLKQDAAPRDQDVHKEEDLT
ncbi:MAG: AGE family epimerase/isomerase [Limimaricola soesokkakensis]|uniref:AGE family epimerase/isomerase n=1 Tax=Limimaricola soesokkakensis TaxID=1343159 RepID=UPI0035115B7A